jgi:hypothetical protein
MNYRFTVHFSTLFSTTSFAAIPQTKLPDSDEHITHLLDRTQKSVLVSS